MNYMMENIVYFIMAINIITIIIWALRKRMALTYFRKDREEDDRMIGTLKKGTEENLGNIQREISLEIENKKLKERIWFLEKIVDVNTRLIHLYFGSKEDE